MAKFPVNFPVSRELLVETGSHMAAHTTSQSRRTVGIVVHRRQAGSTRIFAGIVPPVWFEDRAAPCPLLVFIDDATSRLMELRFVPSESTFAYFEALKSYLQHHGKPVAFYSDKHSIFRVSREDAAS
jgi:hypothetical protein